MDTPDTRIIDFILQHHVMSLATCDGTAPWAANAFYAFDEPALRFLLLSQPKTRHGRQALANPRVAGCVAGQPTALSEIRGLQFEGRIDRLQGAEGMRAEDVYYARFPAARGMFAPVWAISLDHLKFTDNRLGFATKLVWKQTGPRTPKAD